MNNVGIVKVNWAGYWMISFGINPLEFSVNDSEQFKKLCHAKLDMLLEIYKDEFIKTRKFQEENKQ